jgi:Domain of unknown function (DUF6265)
MMQRGLRAAMSGVLAIGMAAAAYGQAPAGGPAAVKATVDQLSWVAGPWRGTLNDRTIEQHWMAPLGGSLVGMYRSIRENRATLYEILAMEQRGDEVFLRIKHFTPGAGLVSQEAKDQSADHVLVKLEARSAVFEGSAGGNPVRVTFSSPDEDTLNITVERQREGKPVATEFKYKRIRG